MSHCFCKAVSKGTTQLLSADLEEKSYPCGPIAGTAQHKSVGHEVVPGPLPGYSHRAVMSRRWHSQARGHTGGPSRPHIHKGRKISHLGRQSLCRSEDTWHSWSHRPANSWRHPGRPTCGCRWLWSKSPSSGCWLSHPHACPRVTYRQHLLTIQGPHKPESDEARVAHMSHRWRLSMAWSAAGRSDQHWRRRLAYIASTVSGPATL